MFNAKDLIKVSKIQNDDEARKYMESVLWGNKPVCPHCGTIGEAYRLKPKPDSKSPVRNGVWECKPCKRQFTVTVGTIFEKTKLPLKIWLLAIHYMCASKKGVSSHQLHRMLGITYKSAWHMTHRIREAMDLPPLVGKLKGVVEADETYVGGKGKGKRGRGSVKKTPVFSLVERNGRIKSTVVPNVTANTLKSVIGEFIDNQSVIITDEFSSYRGLGKEFRAHEVINHSRKEYVRGNIHTNTVEGFFSILKRGINGIYQHVSKQHLFRYVNEFDFRYNLRKISDTERTIKAIRGATGKRLMYKDSISKKCVGN